MRAALYARFSSEDLQTVKSVVDQLHDNRAYAASLGAEVVGDYADEGISGFSLANRPGIQRLLADAARGRFDAVIVESLDRLSRSDIDTLTLFDDLKAHGVQIHTSATRKAPDRLEASLRGLVNGQFLEDLRHKVRRGHHGVVRSGRLIGLPYGYRAVIDRHDARGERIRGLAAIDPETAAVVARIFADFARGLSPERIAAALNAEGVPSPKGARWSAVYIRGSVGFDSGLLNNRLYEGVYVYGRHRHVKDRRTAAERKVLQPEAERLAHPHPELRIIPPELWDRVKARQAATARATVGAPQNARRPKRLLSHLVVCGVCGGHMTVAGGGGEHPAYACRTREQRGPAACTMRRRPNAAGLEARVLEAIKAQLLHPEVIEAAVLEYHRARTALARASARGRAELTRDIAEAGRRMARLIAQVEEGAPWSAVAARHGELVARKAQLEAELERLEAPPVTTLHPNAARLYAEAVASLADTLSRPLTAELAEEREKLRALVRRVVIHPLPDHGEYDAEIETELSVLLGSPNHLNENPKVAGFWVE